jgi:hypothetical protein
MRTAVNSETEDLTLDPPSAGTVQWDEPDTCGRPKALDRHHRRL